MKWVPRQGAWLGLTLGVLVLYLAAVSPRDRTNRRWIPVPGHEGAVKSNFTARSERRAYDGAPPIIPHSPLSASCVTCHSKEGLHVPGLGFAPPSPHDRTPGFGPESNCRQCHASTITNDIFVASTFAGMPQVLGVTDRLYEGAPPVIPHRLFMREDCASCHSGPAAREEIRCTHPERLRCTQCHAQSLP